MVDYTVVRQEKGVRVERYPGYEFTSLAYNYVGRQMEPMIVTVDPDNKKPELVTHKGQEFNYVLEGTVAVILNDKEYILKAGDSIYLPACPTARKPQRAAAGEIFNGYQRNFLIDSSAVKPLEADDRGQQNESSRNFLSSAELDSYEDFVANYKLKIKIISPGYDVVENTPA